MDPSRLDPEYRKFMANLSEWIPEGIVDVDMDLLEKIGFLDHGAFDEEKQTDRLPCYFHVIETADKVTLFNHQFVIWIVPKSVKGQSTTLVLIALVKKGLPRLEFGLTGRGVYNKPDLILRLLRYYLAEMMDTEEEIALMNNNKDS
ncbi:MAG: hypothetical protein OXF02_03890 [Simkaniaceae bacterium]|nr:hypothetical protein [Simkaniaceae bacterium]